MRSSEQREAGPVLIVEDDPSQREALVAILKAEGYAVDCAENGQRALELLRAGLKPCLTLLDLRTPVMDAWAFRRQQQQDPALAAIPVVIMTGEGDTEEEARSIDAVFYFTKPYQIKELLAAVARHCR